MIVKTLYVEITNLCNLNCATCYNRSGLNCKREEISAAALEQMIADFLPYGLERVLLSGGEPTLHSDFAGILAVLDRHPTLTVGVVTNGTTHSAALTAFLRQRENAIVQISLDGSTEAVNAETRGTGNFAKALACAEELRDLPLEKRLKMVVSQKNYGDIEPFYNLAQSLGFRPEFAFIYRSGNGETDWEQKCLTNLQEIKAVKLVDRLNRERGGNAFFPRCTMRCPFSGTLNELSLCIRTDGSIQPCQSLYDRAYSVGNALAFDADVFETGMARIAAIARERLKQDYHCERCMLSAACGKGCMAAAVLLHGDPLADDGSCSFRKAMFIESNILGNISQ